MPTIQITSLVAGNQYRVNIDPWALNPLADDLHQANPTVYTIAVQRAGPPPKMFTDGIADLPAFTSSGLDPGELLRLPYTLRHHAASLSDRAQLHGLFEEYSSDPYARVDHTGLREAILRVRAWASGRMDRDAGQRVGLERGMPAFP
jgi:hypothetical protein